jgi:hypothetical protein
MVARHPILVRAGGMNAFTVLGGSSNFEDFEFSRIPRNPKDS